MSSYIHFTEEQKQRAAAVDLEEFLRCRGEKLLSSGREKRLASDHSVTVRGNEWYDHAEERGGHAVSFVQRFYSLSYVACCGTSIQPVLQMLEQAPQLDTVLLCLDNDEAGHQASRRMREQLEARYSVERLIPENKDWNDDLTLSDENAQGFAMNELR